MPLPHPSGSHEKGTRRAPDVSRNETGMSVIPPKQTHVTGAKREKATKKKREVAKNRRWRPFGSAMKGP